MKKTLHYLFDPLCGWCYGASPAIAHLGALPGIDLRFRTTGLFAGGGARPMGAEFAAYAWSNDQRIERLTGQRFSEQYRRDVLGNHRGTFDSGPATIALTAVALSAPGREPEALRAIQQARYIDGQDTTRPVALAATLEGIGLGDAAARVLRPDPELLEASRARVAEAQALSEQSGAHGVPAFVLEHDGQRRLLHASTAFSDPQAFAQQVAAS